MKELLLEVEAAMSADNQLEITKDIINNRKEKEIWPQIMNLSLFIVHLWFCQSLLGMKKNINTKKNNGDSCKDSVICKVSYKIVKFYCFKKVLIILSTGYGGVNYLTFTFETCFPVKKVCMKCVWNELEGAYLDNYYLN